MNEKHLNKKMKFVGLLFVCVAILAGGALSKEFKFKLDKKAFEKRIGDAIQRTFQKNIDEISKLKDISVNLNDYVDEILQNADVLIVNNGLEPTLLPDVHKHIGWSIFSGSLDMTEGNLTDLSTLTRTGDAVVKYDHQTRNLMLTLPLGFTNIQINYNYKAAIAYVGPGGSVKGNVDNIAFTLTLTVNVAEQHLSLKDFTITNSGHIGVEFGGNIIYTWLLNLLSNTFTSVFKFIILAVLDSGVKGVLQNVLDTVNDALAKYLPPDGPTDLSLSFFKEAAKYLMPINYEIFKNTN